MEKENNTLNETKLSIPMAIIITGVIIAGAIYFSSLKKPAITDQKNNQAVPTEQVANPSPVSASDNVLGNPQAKVTMIIYEDFQCPFCGMFYKNTESSIRDNYVKTGEVELVYRDFPFLGEESFKAAEAARCAGDQGKFWDYHDYLYSHQSGENKGAFSDTNLKSFAKKLNLDSTTFDKCLDGNKYQNAITDSRTEAEKAGVNSTPKAFILRDGKVVSTVNGAEPYAQVQGKIDSALK